MKRIVVITPIYKILYRRDIKTDTQCVHDLLKYYDKDKYSIEVIIPYRHTFKELFRLKKNDYWKYKNVGYDFDVDNISVSIIEWQNIFLRQKYPLLIRKNKICNYIKRKLNSDEKAIDLIISHIPSHSNFIINGSSYSKCHKIAVLHYSDVLYLKKHPRTFLNYLSNNFNNVYCRSESIYKIFKAAKLKNLSEEIIYSGVPYNKNCVIKKHNDSDVIKFLYVGKIIKRKKLDLLINSLSLLEFKKWKLIIIGEGSFENKCKKLVQKLNLNNKVEWLGFMEKEKVFSYMYECDIFCMPSIRETLGLVYLEAMMNGCITVGTYGEGIDGIIKNGENGFLSNPNLDDLKETLEKILKMDQKQKNIVIENAIKTSQQYNERLMSKNYFNIIEKNIRK